MDNVNKQGNEQDPTIEMVASKLYGLLSDAYCAGELRTTTFVDFFSCNKDRVMEIFNLHTKSMLSVLSTPDKENKNEP